MRFQSLQSLFYFPNYTFSISKYFWNSILVHNFIFLIFQHLVREMRKKSWPNSGNWKRKFLLALISAIKKVNLGVHRFYSTWEVILVIEMFWKVDLILKTFRVWVNFFFLDKYIGCFKALRGLGGSLWCF